MTGNLEVPPTVWEAAYLRFETPEEEMRKFQRRLRAVGCASWPRDASIVELFCGRGSGLLALHGLGFTRVEGIDLSATLVGRYRGPGQVLVGDCRALPFSNGCRDILIVQGGLHHLPTLPDDLDSVLGEASRVLRAGGRFVLVEPWLTPFLRVAHWASNRPVARRLWPKLDALATMIEHERDTYEQWLGMPTVIEETVARHFKVANRSVGLGKIVLVGRKR